MPWTSGDAYRHTHKAKSAKAQRQWSHVANSELQRGLPEDRAIRAANAVVGRRGYAAGGSLSPLASIAGDPMAPRASLPKMGLPGGAGHMRMPRVPLADTMRSIDQSMHGARVKLPKLKARVGGRARKKYPDGGPVDRPRYITPGSPGVSGAVHDALAALKDYLIGVPQREIAAARQARENAYIEGTGGGRQSDTASPDLTQEHAAGGPVATLSPQALRAVKAALSHLANNDHSSAAAVLRASPEAMSHPIVQRSAQRLRVAHGLAPAMQALAGLAQQTGSGQSAPGAGPQATGPQ